MLRYYQRISGDQPPSASSSVQQPNRNLAAAVNPPPPEKVPRRVLPANFAPNENNSVPSLFDSIMSKFVKVDDNEKVTQRSHSLNGGLPKCSPPVGICTDTDHKGVHREEAAFQPLVKAKDNAVSFKEKANKESIALVETDDDITGPETPGMQRLASNMKRSREDGSKFGSLVDSGKRVRFLEDSMLLDMTKKEAEVASKFEWLDPSRIRDANGRRPNNPLYDKTTLYIPPEVMRKMSASQKQYWSVKCKYMDVMLFFKVGKFYELYEMDADISHKELDWKITLSGVGKCRQVGISESGIDDAVQKLVARGYKVGRVEQLETSEEAKARGANSVIQRKLVQVVTPSTNVDGNIGPNAVHLLAIKEEDSGLDNGSVVYGFAFVDCARLRFWIGSIDDDASCSASGALLIQVSPKEVIYESKGLSKEAQKALRKFSLNGSPTLQFTPVQSTTKLVNSEIRDLIHSKGYFKGTFQSLDHVLSNTIHREITLSALGELIGHLDRLMLHDILQNGDLYPYQVYRGCLKMDGPTMINLELFANNEDGGKAGSLYNCLDKCVTSSGKRLLRNWICCPLIDAEIINSRLDVVDDLMANPEIVSHIAQILCKLPDMEHLLGRIKSSLQLSGPLLLPLLGKKILKQRVKVFVSLVKGFRTALSLLLLLQKEQPLISSLTKVFKHPVLTGSNGLDQFLVQILFFVFHPFPGNISQPWSVPSAPTVQGHPSAPMPHTYHHASKPANEALSSVVSQPPAVEASGRRELPEFPSMSSLQGALPSVPPAGAVHPSSAGNPTHAWTPAPPSSFLPVLPAQAQTHSSALGPRAYMGQQMPTSMPMQPNMAMQPNMPIPSSSGDGGSSSNRGRREDEEVLPIDMMREVFARLPSRSVVQLHLLNRSYQSLFLEPSFIRLHCGHHSPSFLLLHPFVQPTLHRDQGLLPHASTFDFPFIANQNIIEVVAVCDGLLSILSDRGIVLCNPAIRRHLSAFLPPVPGEDCKNISRFGLGFDSSTNNYKVVMISVGLSIDDHGDVSPFSSVFSVQDRAWTDVQTPPCNLCMSNMYNMHFGHSVWPCNGVVVEGFLHWAGKRWTEGAWYYFILVFNFGSNTYEELRLPDTLASCAFERGVFVVESGNKKLLTVYHIDRTADPLNFSCGIWCMLHYGVVESWTAVFIFEFGSFYIRSPVFEMEGFEDIILTNAPLVLLHRNNGELLFILELQRRRHMFSLNIENRSFRMLPIVVDEEKAACFVYAGYYWESLVSLDQHFELY